MANIRWVENQIFSIRLRNGRHSLLQMLAAKGEVVVFNVFSDNGSFDAELSRDNILFITYISSKSVLKMSEIRVIKNLKPLLGIEFPKYKISLGHGNGEIVLWKDTVNERKFIFNGKGNNLLSEETSSGRVYSSISNNDYEKYKDYEIEGLRIYPEFNERLLLCDEFNANIDPTKELAFNREIPLEFRTYIDIISGKVRLSELGY